MIGEIQQMISEGMCVAVLLLDNSAAFDTVDHTILLHRLKEDYKIKGNALKLIQSYLTERKFSILINDEIGDSEDLSYGVPQGSILGPLFYILYVKPIEKIIEGYDLNVNLYADDVQIYVGFKANNIKQTEKQLEKCMKSIMNWMKANFLKLNPNKTILKLFTPKKQNITPELASFSLYIENTLVQTSSSATKILGVTLGKELNF